jgi:ADP-heptose:LPS heptosyltransferase
VDHVQAYRKNAEANALKVIISPRASEMGAKLMDDFSFEELDEMLIFKGHDAATVTKIKGA